MPSNVPRRLPMPQSMIEARSIDYIPDAERHGGLASQFTLWLSANMQITAIVTGALAVVLGGDVFWSLVGLLVGQLIGGGGDGAARRAGSATRAAPDDLLAGAIRGLRRRDTDRRGLFDVHRILRQRFGSRRPGARAAVGRRPTVGNRHLRSVDHRRDDVRLSCDPLARARLDCGGDCRLRLHVLQAACLLSTTSRLCWAKPRYATSR